ncbi:TonB-dependent receptor domain-containing protein [Caulobacter segnis]
MSAAATNFGAEPLEGRVAPPARPAAKLVAGCTNCRSTTTTTTTSLVRGAGPPRGSRDRRSVPDQPVQVRPDGARPLRHPQPADGRLDGDAGPARGRGQDRAPARSLQELEGRLRLPARSIRRHAALAEYKIDDGRQVNASYSRRIQRPTPGDLNPYRIYRDPYNYRQGDPRLKPQTTDSFEVAYQRRKGFNYYLGTLYWREARDGVTRRAARTAPAAPC